MCPVGVLFDRSVQAFRVRWKALMGIMALEIVGRYLLLMASALAVAAILLGGLHWESLPTLPERLKDLELLASRAFSLVAVLLALVAALAVFEAWLLTALYYAAENPNATLGEALRQGASHFVPFGWVLSLSSLVVLAGLFFLVLPGILASILFLLAPNAYFVEGKTGWSALARAKDCVWPHFGKTARRLGLGWLAFAAGAAAATRTGVPLLPDLFMLVGLPWLVLYHSAVFRELAGAREP